MKLLETWSDEESRLATKFVARIVKVPLEVRSAGSAKPPLWDVVALNNCGSMPL